jgi:hypothetical protein
MTTEPYSKTLTRYNIVRATDGYYIADEDEIIVSNIAHKSRKDAAAELDRWIQEQHEDESGNSSWTRANTPTPVAITTNLRKRREKMSVAKFGHPTAPCTCAALPEPPNDECPMHGVGGEWIDRDKMLEIFDDIGLQFREFDKLDGYGYAGAEPGSLIAHGVNKVYILAPDGTLSVMGINEDGTNPTQVNLKMTTVV